MRLRSCAMGLLGSLLLMSSLVAMPAETLAAQYPDYQYGSGITQVFTLYWNTTNCGGSTGYQIYEWTGKWTRTSTAVSLVRADVNAGGNGILCGGSQGYQNSLGRRTFYPSFGSSMSTPTWYMRWTDWPFVTALQPVAMGGWLQGTYRVAPSTANRYLCGSVYLGGTGVQVPCPITS
jgi:hypothetical protein